MNKYFLVTTVSVIAASALVVPTVKAKEFEMVGIYEFIDNEQSKRDNLKVLDIKINSLRANASEQDLAVIESFIQGIEKMKEAYIQTSNLSNFESKRIFELASNVDLQYKTNMNSNLSDEGDLEVPTDFNINNLENQFIEVRKHLNLEYYDFHKSHMLAIVDTLEKNLPTVSTSRELDTIALILSKIYAAVYIDDKLTHTVRLFLKSDVYMSNQNYGSESTTNQNLLTAYQEAMKYMDIYPATAEQLNNLRWNLYVAELQHLGLKIPANPFEVKEETKEPSKPIEPVSNNSKIDLEKVEVLGTKAVQVKKTDTAIFVSSKTASNKHAESLTIKVEQAISQLKLKTDKGEFSVPFKLVDGNLVAKLNGEGELLLLVGTKPTLKDIEKNYFKSYINQLAERGIVTGYNELFNPQNSATRAEYFAMVGRGLGLIDGDTKSFSDAKGKWFEGVVNSLSELGYVTGYNGNVNPSVTISRQDAFTVLGRLLEDRGYKVPTGKLDMYKDGTNVSSYAAPYIALLNELKIVEGSNGQIRPKANITKGEIAKVLSLVLEKIEYM
jgi:hypothetical protein